MKWELHTSLGNKQGRPSKNSTTGEYVVPSNMFRGGVCKWGHSYSDRLGAFSFRYKRCRSCATCAKLRSDKRLYPQEASTLLRIDSVHADRRAMNELKEVWED